MNKSESKYRNTALCMDEALLLLLQKKDFEFITVKEVCKKAGVNRSTFYLHYENMDDLLQESVDMISRRFRESFDQSTAVFDAQSASKEECFLVTPKYLTPYLAFVKENKSIFRLMQEKSRLFKAEETFEKMYKEIFLPVLHRFGKKTLIATKNNAIKKRIKEKTNYFLPDNRNFPCALRTGIF